MHPGLEHCVRVLVAMLLAVALQAAAVEAQQSSPPTAAASRTPLPFIAKGKGDKCVAPTDWMRRNHMKALIHKRDETMYQGDRTPRFSLSECISCHTVPGTDGKPVTVSDPKHFCRGCHDYAAVRVDCFECHASRPEPGKSAASPHGGAGDGQSDVAALARYLEGAGR